MSNTQPKPKRTSLAAPLPDLNYTPVNAPLTTFPAKIA